MSQADLSGNQENSPDVDVSDSRRHDPEDPDEMDLSRLVLEDSEVEMDTPAEYDLSRLDLSESQNSVATLTRERGLDSFVLDLVRNQLAGEMGCRTAAKKFNLGLLRLRLDDPTVATSDLGRYVDAIMGRDDVDLSEIEATTKLQTEWSVDGEAYAEETIGYMAMYRFMRDVVKEQTAVGETTTEAESDDAAEGTGNTSGSSEPDLSNIKGTAVESVKEQLADTLEDADALDISVTVTATCRECGEQLPPSAIARGETCSCGSIALPGGSQSESST